MRTYKVGLCDADLDYCGALMDYINAHRDMGMTVTLFTGMDEVREYLEVHDLDLIVSSDNSLFSDTDDGSFYMDVKACYLTDYRQTPGGWQIDKNRYPSIYKYQRVELICAEIRALISEKKDVRELHSIYAVYSPLGRCGKTRLAKALVHDDGVRGGLYVSAQDFGEDPEMIDNNLLYLLKSGSPELEEALSSEIHLENGFHSLCISPIYMDMRDVTVDDMERLKASLLKPGKYTTLVFDLGSAVLSDMRILSGFDKIYMPTLSDDVSIRKISVFEKMLKDMGLRSLMTKIQKVYIPDVDENSSEMERVLWKIKGQDEEEY